MPADTSDDDFGAGGRRRPSAKRTSPATLARRKQEVDLTRRSLIGMLMASAAAPAAAQTLKVQPRPVAKPVTPTVVTTNKPVAVDPNTIHAALIDQPDQSDFELIRPADLAVIHFRLLNLRVTGQGKDRHIARVDPSKPGILMAMLPTQAIAENTFPDPPPAPMPAVGKDGTTSTKTGNQVKDVTGKLNSTTVADTRAAGKTKLAFIMPADVQTLPFTVAAVLGACNDWKLNLDIRALDAPADFAEAHSFDRTRARMAAIAKSYAKDLKAYGDAIVAQDTSKLELAAYGGGTPAVEALLMRCADLAAQAMADAVTSGQIVLDSWLDALIDTVITNEIDITLHPEDATPAALPKNSAPSTPANAGAYNWQQGYTYQKAAVHGYVNAQATRKLATLVGKRKPVLNPVLLPPAPTVIFPISVLPDMTVRTIARDATDIEAPYRLHLSPTSTAAFTHATGVVSQHTPFNELWHTHLGTRVGDWVLTGQAEPVRALFNDDRADDDVGPNWALSGTDRTQIVDLTGSRLDSKPALANHMRLTALGASLDIDGSWTAEQRAKVEVSKGGADVAGWKHVSSIGRDQYVRVIYDGFLFPFGHAASLIKISERKIMPHADGDGYAAGLMQRFYIIVREPVRSFPHADQKNEGRDFPFATVEITTRQTPDLIAPTKDIAAADYYSASDAYFEGFWPRLTTMNKGGTPASMKFHTIFTDGAGNRTPIDMPLFFISGSHNNVADKVQTVVDMYGTPDKIYTDRNNFAIPPSLIRFSPPSGAKPEETDHHATSLTFGAVMPLKATGFDAHFYPTVAQATIELRSVKALLGKTASGKFKYHPDYVASAFDTAKNVSELVMKADAAIDAVQAATDKFGGMVVPDFTPDGLSRRFGALVDSAAYEGQKAFDGIDPTALVGNMKLFGVVPVSALIDVIKVGAAPGAVDDATSQAQSLADDPTQVLKDLPGIPKGMVVDTGSAIQTTYTFQQSLKSYALPGFDKTPLFVAEGAGQRSPFLLKTVAVVAKSAGAKSSVTVTAELDTFKISLFGFIAVRFDSLKLEVSPGKKTQVDPKMCDTDSVVFGGPLEFLNTLKSVIPAGGFVDPPGVDVTPDGISASYSLALPTISLGAMSLQNVSLGAGFDLPFVGAGPTARFNFAERQNPFNLTISLFGGGGFFAIKAGTEGVKELEAAIEFGAQISIDLGVASGGVYVKGGFHFLWVEDQHLVHLDAYVEMGGHLDVLGLITVSLVFHLALNYEKQGSATRLYGTATLTVEIDILFFSCSQDITVERQFAGSDSDPSFKAFIGDESVWQDYCDAFAVAA